MKENSNDHIEEYVFHKNDNLIKVIRRCLRLNAGITFINGSDSEEFLSYQKLYKLACQRLYHLQKFGMQRGHELILQLEDNKDFLITFWACILGGIIPVPLSVGKNNDHLGKVIKVWPYLSKPMLITTQDLIVGLVNYGKCHHLNIEEFIVSIEACEPSFNNGRVCEPKGEDIAFIQFSSGSTGTPKGVRLTHHNVIANIVGISKSAKYTKKDSLLSWMPLTHDMGMIGFHLNPLYCGINSYLIPTNAFVRKPTLWIDKASEHQVSVLCSPNFGYRYLLKYLNNKTKDKEWDLSPVRIIYNGAEPISESLCHEFIEEFVTYGLSRTSICPVYGLAEASVAVSMSSLADEVKSVDLVRSRLNPGQRIEFSHSCENSVKFVNVGSPVDGCKLRITHENKLVGDRVIGNIEIKGTNVTSGYHNNVEATNKVINVTGWLTTGDLGFVENGNLYVTGRSKDILFVNGQNYYAHDVENEAQKIHGIELNKIVVSGYTDHSSGSEKLLAFVLYRSSLDDFLLLTARLNELVSSTYGFTFDSVLPVKSIPKTTSGKLQRFKLLNQYLNNEFEEVEQALREIHQGYNHVDIVVPTNDQEALILNVWKEVLEIDRIGIEHKFFEVGGNSLKATMLIARLEPMFNVKLSTTLLYELKTVKALASEITHLPKVVHTPINRFQTQEFYPLSAAQKRIYLAWKIDNCATAYNLPVIFKLEGIVNVEKLESCLNQLIERHEIFRGKFCNNLEPVWSVQPNLQIQLEHREQSNLYESFDQLIRPFDIINGPLLRATLIGSSVPTCKFLFLDFHHIISDGRSVRNFIWELLKCYDGHSLESLSVGYTDYTLWQRRFLQGERSKSKKYWSEKLKNTQLLMLPTDFPRPDVLSYKGKRIFRLLDRNISNGLRELAINCDITVHSILLTAYHLLLHKYSQQDTVTIGIPVHGRIHSDLDQLQGMFVNNLPIINHTNGETSVIEALNIVHSNVQLSLEHQDFTFDEMVDLQKETTPPGRSPLFDTMYTFQDDGITGTKTKDFEISRYCFDPGFSKFDLSLDVIDNGREIECAFEYSTDLFLEYTIVSMADCFSKIVSQLLVDPDIKIADLKLISNHNQLSEEVNLNFESVVDRVKSCCVKQPLSTALVDKNVEMTYKGLHDSLLKATHYLQKLELKKGEIVVIHLPKSCEFIVSILGVLNMGAVFVPLDIDLPTEHKYDILKDSSCSLLIHSKTARLENDTSTFAGKSVWVEDLMREQNTSTSNHEIAKDDLAYIIYTSGTTAKPKGVMVGHESLSNYIHWSCQEYIGEDLTTFPLYSSISFDLTVTSIFAPLTSGNTVIVYEKEDENEVLIQKVFEDDRVDIVKLTPSHLRILRDNDLVCGNTRIKKYIVGGEAFESKLARDLCAVIEDVNIWNEYGPTEATVGCMIHKYNLQDEGDQVSIGKAILNARIYLLDENLKPVLPGMAGEIFVSGNVLAKGYLKRAKLTNERFLDNPFVEGEKMYKTGDYAKEKPDGNLEYIGRRDGQVKIKGHRVELSHIENILLRHHSVSDAIALLAEDELKIIAFYVLNKNTKINEPLWRRELSAQLPYYMMPSNIYAIKSMPLTSNGKVDTKSLLSLVQKNEQTNTNSKSLTKLQLSLLEVWREVLETEDVGVDDNFYQLGGDSIKAVLISTRLYEKGLSIKTKEILLHHTIRQISTTIEVLDEAKGAEPSLSEGSFGLSPIQHWFFNQNFKNPDFYAQSIVLKLNKNVNYDLLSQSFNHLLHYHDTLRLNYDLKSKCMFYNNELLNHNFIIGEYEVDKEEEVIKVCQRRKRDLKIHEGILLKADLIKITSTDARLLFITVHHLIIDGISWRVLLSDLYRDYSKSGGESLLHNKQKTASYKAYVTYLNQPSTLEHFAAERDYWQNIVDREFIVPEDESVGFGKVTELGVVSSILDEKTTTYLLKEAHRIYNTDIPILLNTVLLLALEEWTGLKRYIIEQESHGRNYEALDLGGTIGWFTSIFPLNLVYQDDLPSLIKSVKETFKKVPNNGVGYGINRYLVDKSNIVDRPEVRFNYLGQFGGELNNDLFNYLPEFNHGPDSDPENSLTAKLELNCMVLNDQLHIHINYNRNAYLVSRMKYLVQLFDKHLSAVLAHIKNKEEVDFTPSDFTNASLDNEEMNALFN